MTYAATTDDAFEAWLRGKARRTRLNYTDGFDRYTAWREHPDPAAALDELLELGRVGAERLIERWADHMQAQGLAARTIRLRMATVTTLIKAARRVGLCDWVANPQRPASGATRRDTKGPTPEQFRKVLVRAQTLVETSTEKRRPHAVRNLAILTLAGFCALRIHEIVSLDAEHVDLEHSAIHAIRKGSHGHRDRVRIPRPVAEALGHWMRVRAKLLADAGLDLAGPVFIAFGPNNREPGVRLAIDTAAGAIVRAGRAVGITLSPHRLRHYAITRALALGAKPQHVQHLARHKNLQTTQIYDDQLSRERDQLAVAELVAANFDRTSPTGEDDPLPVEPVHTTGDALALLLADDDPEETP